MRKGPLALLILAPFVVAFLAGTWVAYWASRRTRLPGGRRSSTTWTRCTRPISRTSRASPPTAACSSSRSTRTDPQAGRSVPGPPGTATIPREKQQAFGVAVGKAEKVPWAGTAPAPRQGCPRRGPTYRINAATDIWVRKVFPPTTGSLVRKDEPLAAYFTSGFLAAANAYMFALDTKSATRERRRVPGPGPEPGFPDAQAVGNLINMGVSESQIREMEKTREGQRTCRDPIPG